ncbi:hypothetical protein B0H34DRAFT_466730 [Crassisporium funariophilum]|nr:hypothetical protein B0H34DRAFT_466730 [Crassisporium funariophilum]
MEVKPTYQSTYQHFSNPLKWQWKRWQASKDMSPILPCNRLCLWIRSINSTCQASLDEPWTRYPDVCLGHSPCPQCLVFEGIVISWWAIRGDALLCKEAEVPTCLPILNSTRALEFSLLTKSSNLVQLTRYTTSKNAIHSLHCRCRRLPDRLRVGIANTPRRC